MAAASLCFLWSFSHRDIGVEAQILPTGREASWEWLVCKYLEFEPRSGMLCWTEIHSSQAFGMCIPLFKMNLSVKTQLEVILRVWINDCTIHTTSIVSSSFLSKENDYKNLKDAKLRHSKSKKHFVFLSFIFWQSHEKSEVIKIMISQDLRS